MEFGSHCSVQECSLLDFLPFTCTACLQIYCKEHRFSDAHNCSAWSKLDKTVIFCKKCNQILQEEQLLSEHLESNCTIGIYLQQKSPECNLENCTNKSFINCKYCNLSYCILHRHLQDHKCKSLSSEKPTLTRVELPVVPLSNITIKKKSSKNPVIELMKLKAKATGDVKIPVADRVYFTISLPKKQVVMYFSKNWTVGKVVDKISLGYNIPNFNNNSHIEVCY